MLNLEQKALSSANKAFGLIEDMTWDMDKEFHNYHQEAFKEGYHVCQKEYEEKLRWIPVEEKLPDISKESDIYSDVVTVREHDYYSPLAALYNHEYNQWISYPNSVVLSNVTEWRRFL